MKLFVLIWIPFILVESIHAFCIYNNVTEGVEVHAKQDINSVPIERVFHVKIDTNSKQCCHFSNKDCSPNGSDEDPAEFIVSFLKEGSKDLAYYRVGCTTGGAITLYNKDDERHERIAACAFANKTAIYVPLKPIEYTHADPI